MYDMGTKPDKSKKGMDCCVGEMANETRYPNIYDVDSEKFPPMKSMQVGKEYEVTMKVKPTRITIDKGGKMSCSMDIIQMGMDEPDTTDSKLNKMVDGMYPEKAKK